MYGALPFPRHSQAQGNGRPIEACQQRISNASRVGESCKEHAYSHILTSMYHTYDIMKKKRAGQARQYEFVQIIYQARTRVCPALPSSIAVDRSTIRAVERGVALL